MAVKGTPRIYQKKFLFIVEFEGFGSSKFSKCSELSAEIAEVTQWEGGALIPDKSPGRVTIADVTLERGVATGDSDYYDWFTQVVNVTANKGLVTPEYKRTGELIQLDRDGSILKRYALNAAWPKKLVVGEWDNDSDENVVETLVLAIDSFDKLEG